MSHAMCLSIWVIYLFLLSSFDLFRANASVLNHTNFNEGVSSTFESLVNNELDKLNEDEIDKLWQNPDFDHQIRQILERRLDTLSFATINKLFFFRVLGSPSGPCENDNQCVSYLCGIPEELRSVRIVGTQERINSFVFVKPETCNSAHQVYANTPVPPTGPLVGRFETKKLSCSSFRIGGFSLKKDQVGPNKSFFKLTLKVSSIEFFCDLKLGISGLGYKNFQNSKDKSSGAEYRSEDGGCFRTRRYRNPVHTVSDVDATVATRRSSLKNGMSISLTFQLEEYTENYGYSVLTVPGVGSCYVNHPLNVKVNIHEFSNKNIVNDKDRRICSQKRYDWIDSPFGFTDLLTSLFGISYQGRIGNTFVCRMIKNLIVSGKNTSILKKIVDSYITSSNAPLQDRSDFEKNEAKVSDTFNFLDFGSSRVFETISVGLNKVLGKCDAVGCAINGIMQSMFPSGKMEFIDLVKNFEFKEYPNIPIDSGMLKGRIELQSFSFLGFNTFKNFQVLDNGFANPSEFGSRYKYHTITKISMGSLDTEFVFLVSLEPGHFFLPPLPFFENMNKISMPFRIKLNLNDLTMKVVPFLTIVTDTLLKLEVGTIFGTYPASAKQIDRFKCLLAATKNGFAEFSSLQMTAASGKLSFESDGSEDQLETAIKSTISILDEILTPYLLKNLEKHSERFIRGEINKKLLSLKRICNPVKFVDEGYINFQTSKIFEIVETAINDGIGGIPVKKNGGDINTILETYIDYLMSKTSKEVIDVRKTGSGNYTLVSILGKKLLDFEVKASATQEERKLKFSDLQVFNLNSIFNLALDNAEAPSNLPHRFFFQTKIGDGDLDIPGTSVLKERRGAIGTSFSFDSLIRSPIHGVLANDSFFTSFAFGKLSFALEMDVQVNKAELFGLTFEDLLNLDCLLAVTDAKNVINLSLDFENFFFVLDLKKTSESKLGNSLKELGKVNRALLTRNMRYFVSNGLANDLKDKLNGVTVNKDVKFCSDKGKSTTGFPLFDKLKPFFNDFQTILEGMLNSSVIEKSLNQSFPLQKPLSVGRKDGGVTMCYKDFLVTNPGDFSCYNEEKKHLLDLFDGEIMNRIREQVNDVNAFRTLLRDAANFKWKQTFDGVDFNNIVGGSLGTLLNLAIIALEGLVVEPNGQVNLRIPLSEFGFLESIQSDRYAPGLRIDVGEFVIINLDRFNDAKFKLLAPYANPDQLRENVDLFTMDHTIVWDETIFISADVNVTVDPFFTGLSSSATLGNTLDDIKNQFKFQLDIKDFEIDLRTITALNLTRLGEIPIGYYLNALEQGGALPRNCLGTMFLRDGLEFEKLWINGTILNERMFSQKSFASNQKLVINEGFVNFVDAILDIVIKLTVDDIPRYFHKVLRGSINTGAKLWIDSSHQKGGDCGDSRPLNADISPYLIFLKSPKVEKIFSFFNRVIGGKPVQDGVFGYNNLIDVALNQSLKFITKNEAQQQTNSISILQSISHPRVGQWGISKPVDFNSSTSIIQMTDFLVSNFDSAHTFTLNLVPPDRFFEFDVDFAVGGGQLFNNKTKLLIPKSDLSFEIDSRIFLQRPGKGIILANEQFKLKLVLNRFSIKARPEVQINLDRLYDIPFRGLLFTQCVLSTLDFSTFRDLRFDFVNVNLLPIPFGNIGFANDSGNSSLYSLKHTKLGVALSLLNSELRNPSLIPKFTLVLKQGLRGLATSFNRSLSEFELENFPTEDCSIKRKLFSINSGVLTSSHAEALKAEVLKISGVTKVLIPVKDGKYRRLYVSSNRFIDDVDEDEMIRLVINAARKSRVSEKKPVVVDLSLPSSCAEVPFFGESVFEPLCGVLIDSQGNITKVRESFVGQINLVDRKIPASDIEGQVKILKGDNFYNVSKSFIVKGAVSFFEKRGPTKLRESVRSFIQASSSRFFHFEELNATFSMNVSELFEMIDDTILSSTTFCSENGSIFSDFRFRDLLEEDSTFIPRLRFRPQNLTISNFDDFAELVLFKPYPKAAFTTQHTVSFRGRKPIGLKFALEIDFEETYFNPEVVDPRLKTEAISIEFEFHDMYLQVLSLLAVNTDILGSLSLSQFVDFDKEFHDLWSQNIDVELENNNFQSVTRNCFALSCLLTSVYDQGIFLPQLWLNFTDISGPRFKSNNALLSPGLSKLIDATVEIGIQQLLEDIPMFFQGYVRNTINEIMVKTVGDAKTEGACPQKFSYSEYYPKSISVFDFQKSQELRELNQFIENTLLNSTSELNLNSILKNFVGNIKTGFVIDIPSTPLKYRGSNYGTISLKVGEFQIRGLENIDTLKVFDVRSIPDAYPTGSPTIAPTEFPSAEYEVDPNRTRNPTFGETPAPTFEETPAPTFDDNQNRLRNLDSRAWTTPEFPYLSRTQFSHGELNGTKQKMEISLRIAYEFQDLFETQQVVKDDLRLTIILSNTDLIMDIFAMVNIPSLMELQIRSIGSLTLLPCFMSIFEDQGLIPAKFDLIVEKVGFKLQCVSECTSPFFSEKLKTGELNSESNAALTKTFSDGFNSAVELLVNFMASTELQESIDNLIETAKEDCKTIISGFEIPDVPSAEITEVSSLMGIAFLVTLFFGLFGLACLVPVHSRRRLVHLKLALLENQSLESEKLFNFEDEKLKSAFQTVKVIPNLVRFLVPVILLLNTILFISANFFSIGASVELRIQVVGTQTVPLIIKEFTLANSIDDMWSSHSYFLALLIAFASGAWPFVKQIALAFCWFAPGTIISVTGRQHMIEVLETLGKISLIDVFVLVLFQVAFKFFITTSYIEQLSLLPENFAVVEVSVIPGWGIFGFTFGVIGSLIAGHIMLWYNKKIITFNEAKKREISKLPPIEIMPHRRRALWKHSFGLLTNTGIPYHYGILWQVIPVGILALGFIFVLIGAFVPLISFQFKGVAGLLIAVIDQSLFEKTYSLVSIGTELISGTLNRDNIVTLSVVLLQAMYFSFGLILPLLSIALLIVLFVMPFSLENQIRMEFVTSMVSAWEALIIVLISLIAAVLQISQLAQFIVRSATGDICAFAEIPLKSIFPGDESAARCFDVEAKFLIDKGFILILAVVLQIVGGMTLTRLIHAAIQDRHRKLTNQPSISPALIRGLEGFLVRRALQPMNVEASSSSSYRHISKKKSESNLLANVSDIRKSRDVSSSSSSGEAKKNNPAENLPINNNNNNTQSNFIQEAHISV